MSEAIGAYRLVVTGRVQGVGFRHFTRTMAHAFDIVGTVRNRHDGSVEILASGTQANIRSFREQVELGPAGARVDRVLAERLDAEDVAAIRSSGRFEIA